MSPRRALRPPARLWPLLALALLTLALTWPVARFLGTHVPDRQDPLLNAWIMAWEAHQLLRDPLHLFQANIFYPYPFALAFSEILLSTTALVLPIRWAGASPILTYNLAFLLAFFTTALGGYLFALSLTRSRLAAIVAAAVYTFSPYRMGHLSQVQLLAAGWLPLALLVLDRLLGGRGPLRRNTALFALFFILQALASFYSAVFAALACAVYATGRLLLMRRVPWRVVAAVAVAAGVVGLVIGPFTWPYLRVQRELGAGWSLADAQTFSASLQAYAYAPPETRLWGPLTAGLAYIYGPCCPPDTLFPGVTAVILAGVGLARSGDRRRWLLLALLLLGLLFSLGPVLQVRAGQPTSVQLPYAWLFTHVPGLQALRAPVRWAGLVTLGLALLAAYGLAAVRRDAPRVHPLLSLLALLLVLGEFSVAPLRLVAAPVPPPVAAWLASRPPTRIVELPLAAELPTPLVPPEQPRRAWEVSRLLERQIASTLHWHTTPDGYSGYVPPRHGDFAREMQTFPSERSLALLRGLGIEYVVLHRRDMPAERRARIEARLPDFPALSVAVRVEEATVLRVAPGSPASVLEWSLRAPAQATASGAIELFLSAQADRLVAVPPTRRYVARVDWGDRVEMHPITLPLVVEGVAVVPVAVTAPATLGPRVVSVQVAGEAPEATESVEELLQAEVLVVEEPVPASPRPLAVELATAEVPRRSAAGSALSSSLAWRALQPLDHYASISLRLVAPDGSTVAQQDGPPGGATGTLAWLPGEPYGASWRLEVPAEASAGRYSIQVLWYDPTTGRPALVWHDESWVEAVSVGEVEIGD